MLESWTSETRMQLVDPFSSHMKLKHSIDSNGCCSMFLACSIFIDLSDIQAFLYRVLGTPWI